MNKSILTGSWDELKGNVFELKGKIQKIYRLSFEEAKRELHETSSNSIKTMSFTVEKNNAAIEMKKP